MTDVHRASHHPLTGLDAADLWADLGYASLTPAKFREMLASVVAKVLAAQAQDTPVPCGPPAPAPVPYTGEADDPF